jgi:hypothetical protein
LISFGFALAEVERLSLAELAYWIDAATGFNREVAKASAKE